MDAHFKDVNKINKNVVIIYFPHLSLCYLETNL